MSWWGRDHSLARNAVGRGLRCTPDFAIDSFRKGLLDYSRTRSMIQAEVGGDVVECNRILDMPF
jgi:hypothetical protein